MKKIHDWWKQRRKLNCFGKAARCVTDQQAEKEKGGAIWLETKGALTIRGAGGLHRCESPVQKRSCIARAWKMWSGKGNTKGEKLKGVIEKSLKKWMHEKRERRCKENFWNNRIFFKSVFLDNFIVGCFILFKYFTTCNVLLVKSKYWLKIK